MTIACAPLTLPTSSAGHRSSRESSANAIAGVDKASRSTSPVQARTRPARHHRSRINGPAIAISNGPVGGSTSALNKPLSKVASITRFFQELLQVFSGNGVGDAARLSQCRFLRALHETGRRRDQGNAPRRLVVRFRSSPVFGSRSGTNFGISGPLATLCF